MYSLTHSRRLLKRSYDWYMQKDPNLSLIDQQQLKEYVNTLNDACQSGDRSKADYIATELEAFSKIKYKKSTFQYIREVVVAILIALIIATVVRATWFELYQIPTGSMRPQYRELDHLSVTKLPFSINIPLMTDHFLFEPEHVQRTSAVTFSGDNIPSLDETTMFLGIFPYKKRLIKRMVGLPGDTLYFYGGKAYGIDKDGNPIDELLTSPWLEKIEYIPYMTFNGIPVTDGKQQTVFMQMDKAVGKVQQNPLTGATGFVWTGKEWIKDDPAAQKSPHDTVKTFSDWWGTRNYAMARLLTKEQVKHIDGIDTATLPEGVLYLELRHTPSLTYPKPLLTSENMALPDTQRTVIPLQQKDLNALMDNMYTARLEFENEHGRRYSVDDGKRRNAGPYFPKVPDGTYEFVYGKGYKVNYIWLPIIGRLVSSIDLLPADHPLNARTPENIQKLFNLGIEMNTYYEPQSPYQLAYPSRYAYFRDGDLYSMGGVVLKKDDPTLKAFVQSEEKKEKQSSNERPYIAFKDYGAPLKDGKIDADFIKTFGVHVPEKNYFVLGDNHAMSADSRVFGFVPENNLQGAPSLILWPTDRWGKPWQKPYPIFNESRMIVWTIIGIIALAWYLYDRRKLHRSYHIA